MNYISHHFVEGFDNSDLDRKTLIARGDHCIYCRLIIDTKMVDLFLKVIERDYDVERDMEEYWDDLEFCYKCLDKLYPCLTEEEFNIKKILE